MVWHSPKGAFTVIDPPVWLQHDLQIAEARTPLGGHVKTLALFADDLPAFEQLKAKETPLDIMIKRKAALSDIMRTAWGFSLDAFHLADGMLMSRGFHADTNTFLTPSNFRDEKSGLRFEKFKHTHKPDRAVILLGQRSFNVQHKLAGYYRVTPATVSPDISVTQFQRGRLWHELGHVWRALCCPRKPLTARAEERLCDLFSIRGCVWAGDAGAASLLRQSRALDALQAPIAAGPMRYWNALSLSQSTLSYADELAAQLEVKARALGQGQQYNLMRPSIRRMVIDDYGSEVRAVYDSPVDIKALLRTLDQADRTLDYHSPAARNLAHLTLKAGERLLPGIASLK